MDLDKLEKKRKITVILGRVFWIILFLNLLLIFGNFTFLKYFSYNALTIISIILNTLTIISIILLVIIFPIYLISRVKVIRKLKVELMKSISNKENIEDLAEDIHIKKYQYNQELGMSEAIFKLTKFINYYDTYNAFDYFSATLDDDKTFELSQIKIKKMTEDESGKTNYITLFEGIFGSINTDTNYNFDLKITPDIKNKFLNQAMSDFKKMLGANKNVVRLENPEFERFFEVYSSNQVEARKVVTINFMEELLKLRKKINKNITVIYMAKRVYFFIERGSIINEKLLLKEGITKETMKETINNLNEICNTVSLL